MKHLTLTLAAAAGFMCSTAMAGSVIFNDNFADGDRSNSADAHDTNWWTSSNSSSIEISRGVLGLVTGGSGRGIRTTFAPQAFAEGQAIKATFTFVTPRTIGKNRDSSLRVGMYNKAGRAALEGDLSASSKKPNPLYNGLPGFMIDFDVNLDDAAKANISIRKHKRATTGRLLGTTKGYHRIGGGGNPYKFAPGQTYVGTMTIERVEEGVEVSGSLSHNGRVLSEYSKVEEGSNLNNIGMLAFHANSKTFGSSKKKNTPDNGIDFRNVKVELLP